MTRIADAFLHIFSLLNPKIDLYYKVTSSRSKGSHGQGWHPDTQTYVGRKVESRACLVYSPNG